MEAVQLFLDINRPGLNNQWNLNLTNALKALPSAEQVLIVEKNESSFAQISISYKPEELSINEIEKIVNDSGANITDINIHFPSGVTGIADPYRASALSVTVDGNLKKIKGVLSGAISSRGELKVLLDTTDKNKEAVIDEILIFISSFSSAKS